MGLYQLDPDSSAYDRRGTDREIAFVRRSKNKNNINMGCILPADRVWVGYFRYNADHQTHSNIFLHVGFIGICFMGTGGLLLVDRYIAASQASRIFYNRWDEFYFYLPV